MIDFLARLFDSSGFPPRWRCGTWTPAHGWLHIAADSLIFSAYFAIPVVLWYFARRRPDWPFRRLLWLFGAFILACGTTHLMEAVIFWWPAYRLAGALKATTAVISCVTVVALIPAIPKALAMRTPEELGREVDARRAAEAELVRANAELADRVRERTAELTAANRAMFAERERFRTTLASIGDGVIATDTAGRVTFLNPAAEGQTGWSTATATGQPLQTVLRIVNETSRAEVENPAVRALREGVVVGLANHTVLIGRDGSERPIDDCAAPIRDEAGAVAGAVLVFRDVSERRRAEVAQAEQARLTALRADIATALATDQPEEAALQACCEAVVRHLGAAFARVWTLPDGGDTLELRASAGLYTRLDGPHGRVRVGQFKIGRIAATGEPHLTNAVAGDPDVSDRGWAAREGVVAFAGHPLAVEGRVVGVLALFARHPLSPGVLSDLAQSADNIAQYTDRRRAEAQMRASEGRYRMLFDANPHPMWVFDRGTLAFLAVNDAAVAKYGYTRAEFLARTIKDIRPPEDVPALLADVARPVDGLDDAGVWRHRVKDGRAIRVRIASHRLPFDGRPAELVLAQDVTEQLRAEEELRASEERYRLFFDASPLPMWVYDQKTLAFLEVNAAAVAEYGYTRDEFLSRTVTDIRPAEELPALLAVLATPAGPTEASVWRHRLKDGRVIRVRVKTHNLTFRGRPARLVQAQDVTEQLRAEEQLRASEAKFRALYESSVLGVAFWDEAGGLSEVNDALLDMVGYTRSEFAAGQVNWRAMTPEEYRAADDRAIGELRAGLPTYAPFEKEYVRKDGVRVPVLLGGALLPGQRDRGVSFIIDLSSRNRAEAGLRASERLLRQVIDTDPNFIVVKDRDGRFALANRAMADAYGTTADGLLGKTDADFHPVPAEYAAYRAAERGVFATGDEFHAPEEPFTTAWGERRWLRTTKRLLAGGDDRPPALLAVAVDITAQKAVADALAASNRLYQLLADHMSDVVMLSGADGGRYVSPSCERLTGFAAGEVLRDGLPGLAHPDDRPGTEAAYAAALDGRAGSVEWRCRHRDGRYLWVETVLTPVSGGGGVGNQVVASSRDVTGRRAVEDQLRQAQKLEAIGQLAGGVAHDFNNLLTVVNGCGELALADLPADAPARPLVEAVVAAGERGAGLTRQLLAFGRQQMFRTEVFDLSGALPATAKLVGRLLGEDILMSLRLDPAAGSVRADLGQVEQIVINLAVNARDAMPAGGTLVIETAPAEVPDAAPRPSPDARPGRYVRLSVTDSGHGMAPEVKARLFEPFFTTKPVGKGTGLGLATVYGIVRQSGGFLAVESEVGRGTTFAVFLPRHDTAPDGPKSSLRPRAKAGGGETVLVVEDDGSVRALTTAILLRRGYRVESAEDGAAALAACERLPAPPDLLLTDVVMPGMSGRELAEALTARYPRLRVAFLSGYTADEVLRHGVEEERMAFLQKPYTPDGLARLVRRALDGSAYE